MGLVNLPPSKAEAAEQKRLAPAACEGMAAPGEDGKSADDENHASIRLDMTSPHSEVAVDEQGKIDLKGVLHKHAEMEDVSLGKVVTTDFTLGPPPDGVAAWASSWATRLRPPQLGENLACVRAKRDPKRSARLLRSFTVVDRIAPSDVNGLSVGDITSATARASWSAATDNYGLAGYEVRIDGGAPIRTNVGTRSYTMTGLSPNADHTVSVVAVDLAGNKSAVPAKTTFHTKELPPEPDPKAELKFDVEAGGADAKWQPDPKEDSTYRVFLDGQLYDEFSLKDYCADPCTADSVIKYTIEPLESSTPYSLRIDAMREDGSKRRDFSGDFTTKDVAPAIPEEVTQQVTSEASQCAAQGGDFYVAESMRSVVKVPGGSTEVFPGCYAVANASCIHKYMPPEKNQKLDCSDDVTRLLHDLASPGGGPVLSSLSGATGGVQPLLDPGTLVEPVVWCEENTPTCALLLAPPVVVGEAAAAASVLATAVFWVVVIAAAIAIGTTLGALWAILTPSPIAIGGILEYPIHYTDDLNTFDKWGLENGQWYHSLTAYAQVLKTTKELASKYNLPFAWTSSDDADLRANIDQACAAQKQASTSIAPCDENFAVYVPGGRNYRFEPMQETGKHIVEAMGNGRWPQPAERNKWFGPARSIRGQAARAKGYERSWYYNDERFARNNPCLPRPAVGAGKTCDEFPFWATDQAVDLSGLTADLRLVPGAETHPQMRDNSAFPGKCRVNDNERYIVLPVKPWVAANAPSFGFRVNSSGASLCMEPTLPAGTTP
ncbi:fibronectin type III domain-containing protein [Streptomyces sp. NBC_00557]|uniref:fibronectin type III domain-containing protein n=1 Tax=Streptomyces sp. NBC_00557 TaxID=2975776 RepID=UPI002E807400|nr:hypothetical protein [Streptomyces sp. NBC_00557]WUC39609.1 hypothetical protein OG956_38235 [Streptomyces sp. NBC_00557]